MPDTRYAKTPDGLSIAFQTLGSGPTDIVFLPWMTCIDLMWEEPSFAHVLRRLARVGRLICFDYRGFGSSDPVPLGALPTPEVWMDDLRVVLDAMGSTTTSLVANATAGYMAMLFAATYPERTNALVLVDTTARMWRADDYAFGRSPERWYSHAKASQDSHGSGGAIPTIAPSRADDAPFRRWLGWYERGALSQASYLPIYRWNLDLDMRPVLPAIRVPTLVVHHDNNRFISRDHGRYLAEHIPGARLIELPGADSLLFTHGADEVVDHIEEFVTGVSPAREPDRALATVLFTDIVSSTEHAARLGDKRWRQVLDQHDALVQRELERHRGRKVNPTGDGIVATFDGPARAVRSAQAICEGVRALGIEVRAGLHTGEVELRGEDIAGIAVHICQRVSAQAGPSEVVVSSTVKDLVAGSGIVFADRGTHALKGVPDEWRLFAVET